MDENPLLPDEERGLYPKYRIVKIPHYEEHEGFYDDQVRLKANGFPMAEVTEPTFVLKFSDPHARQALIAYADSCEAQYPKLAADIRVQLAKSLLKGFVKDLADRGPDGDR